MPIVELAFFGAGSTSFRLFPFVSAFLLFLRCFSSSCRDPGRSQLTFSYFQFSMEPSRKQRLPVAAQGAFGHADTRDEELSRLTRCLGSVVPMQSAGLVSSSSWGQAASTGEDQTLLVAQCASLGPVHLVAGTHSCSSEESFQKFQDVVYIATYQVLFPGNAGRIALPCSPSAWMTGAPSESDPASDPYPPS